VTTEPFIDFQGLTIIVTGASSGIGRAIAIELGRHGAEVVLIGRNPVELTRTQQLMAGQPTHVVELDLQEGATILPRVRAIVQEHGRIYGLCHCAGIVETRPLTSFNVDSFKTMMQVNLLAGIELAQVVSRRDVMTENGGAILLMSSIYGSVAMPGQIGYCATKGAVLAAARAMAVELARRRIRVNTLSPGLVRTPMTAKALSALSPEQARDLELSYPLGPGDPEDVARAAAFLLAPQNKWITGTDLIIDGGYTAR
jgi:NAD(P)-dependent dehydrogenase (short-subunit alcohol dehydrogenase family)